MEIGSQKHLIALSYFSLENLFPLRSSVKAINKQSSDICICRILVKKSVETWSKGWGSDPLIEIVFTGVRLDFITLPVKGGQDYLVESMGFLPTRDQRISFCKFLGVLEEGGVVILTG